MTDEARVTQPTTDPECVGCKVFRPSGALYFDPDCPIHGAVAVAAGKVAGRRADRPPEAPTPLYRCRTCGRNEYGCECPGPSFDLVGPPEPPTLDEQRAALEKALRATHTRDEAPRGFGAGATLAALRVAGWTLTPLGASPPPPDLSDGPWQQMSDAATPGPWHQYRITGEYVKAGNATVADLRYKNGKADAALIVAAVNYVRAALGRATPEEPSRGS